MSLTEGKRNKIKLYILESMFNRRTDVVNKTSSNFGISKQTVYKYIKEMREAGVIEKEEYGKYVLVQTVDEEFRYKLKEKRLEEDIIFTETLEPYIKDLNDNAYRIWQYAFTEMVNNAIDHSNAENLRIHVSKNAFCTWVNIYDNGIGIFKKISAYYNYETLDDAIVSLFKGKLTTDKENHSGEGIFFTSKVMDHFGAISSNRLFEQNNTVENIWNLEEIEYSKIAKSYRDKKGTLIILALANSTDRSLKEVFDTYSDVNGGFTITKIPIKRICDSGYPVSRSQAKRLYFGFDKFKKVILDFSGVDEIGQAFAHELFNVFKKNNPEIEIECINENEEIKRMIARVTMG